jgi:ankyrin repeat protein
VKPRKPPSSAKSIVDAAQKADTDSIKALLKRGGDINAQYRGYRALHALIQTKAHADAVAPSAKQLKAFSWLLDHGADPDLPGAWPPARAILVAAFAGTPQYVDLLVRHGFKSDAFVSAALGDAAAVKRAIGRDRSIAVARDPHGLTLLQCAAASRMGRADVKTRRRLVSIAEMALDAGAEPHAATKSWLHDVDAVYFAASSHQAEMLDLLLQRGGDATRALTNALWNGGKDHAALAEIALRHGADVNKAEAESRPLLNDLIRWGQFGPARWLLEHGANPNRAQGMDGSPTAGWTALHQAASRGNIKMVEDLIKAGADIARKDAAGAVPADIARVKAVLQWLTP